MGPLSPEATAASTPCGGEGARGLFSTGGRHSTNKPLRDVAHGAIRGGDLEAVSQGSELPLGR